MTETTAGLQIKVLALGVDAVVLERLRAALAGDRLARFEVNAVAAVDGVPAALPADVILLHGSHDTLRSLRQQVPGLPVVVLAEPAAEPAALDAVGAGAHDYLLSDEAGLRVASRVLRGVFERGRAQYLTQSTLDALSAHICVLDTDGRIVAVNQAWRDFAAANSNGPASDYLGVNYLQICAEAAEPEAALVADAIRAALRGERQSEAVVYPCHAPNQQRWFAVRAARAGGASPVQIVVTHEDITERRQVEAALRSSEENLRHAQELAHVGHWAADLRSLIITGSAETYRIFGWPPRPHTVREFMAALHPESRRPVRQAWRAVLFGRRLQEEPIDLEFQFKVGDHYKWLHLRGLAERDTDGRARRLTGTLQDITKRKQSEIALADERRRLRTVLDSIPDLVWLKDASGAYQVGNPTWAHMVGIQESEARGKTDFDLFDPVQAQEFRRQDQLTISDGRQRYIEEELAYPANGRRIRLETIKTAMYDSRGNLAGILGIARDISQRREAEEALRQSEERYRTLFESMTQGVVYRAADGRITGANPAAERILGMSLAQLAEPQNFPRPWVSVYEDGSPFPEDLEPGPVALRTGQPVYDVLLGLRRTDTGDVRWLNVSAIPQFHPGGTSPFQVYTIFEDVTERRRAAEALKAEHDFAVQVMEALGQGVTVTGPGGIYEYVNPAYGRIVGLSPEQLRGLSPRELTFEDDWPVLEEARSQRKTGGINSYEVRLKHADGRLVPVLITGSPRWQAGRIIGAITVVTDLTERIQAEEALKRSETQYRLLADNMSDAVWLMDMTMRSVFDSPSLTRLRGFSSQESKTLPLERLVTAGSLALARSLLAAACSPENLNSPAPHLRETVELEFYHADGSTFWAECTFTLILDSEGRPVNIAASARNVSARKLAEAALQDSVRRYRLLFENSGIGIVLVDRAGNVLEVNPAALVILGSPSAEATRRINVLTFPPLIQAGVAADVQACFETGQPMESERPYISHWNRMVYTHLRLTPIVNADGQVELIQILIEDISERRRLAEEVRVNAELYRSLIESLESGVLTLDSQGRLFYLNPLAAAILGGTPESLKGRVLGDFIPPALQAVVQPVLQEVIAAGQGRVEELVYEIAGKPRWYRVSLQPVRDAAGGAGLVLVNALDITLSKEAELVLEEKVRARTLELDEIRRRLELATRAAELGVWDWNLHTGELIWDDQMLAIYGWGRDKFDGSVDSFLRIVYPEDREMIQSMIAAVLAGEPRASVTYRISRGDGSLAFIEAHGSTVADSAGRVERIVGVIRDMTAARQAEAALRQANLELAQANRTKDEFMANMSHELRTPLNGILALSEVLQEGIYGPVTERQLKALKSQQASGQHLLSLINDVLDISKIAAGRLTLSLEWIGLEEIIQASLALVRESALRKGVELQAPPEAPGLRLYADGRRLKQILINLLNNGIKFTPAGGRVSLAVETDDPGRRLHISVTDTGIGIAPEDVSRLFKPFVQLDPSLSRQYEGTGLGLALVNRLVELHNGRVSVDSAPGKGSRFTVSLPWEPARPVSPAGQPASGQPVVLLAEDSRMSAAAIRASLEAQGCEVLPAASAIEALAAARARRPDLILLSAQLPAMDSLELIRRLREIPGLGQAPVIVLTALTMPGDRERFAAAGAADYLNKPVGGELLRQHLPAWLAAREG